MNSALKIAIPKIAIKDFKKAIDYTEKVLDKDLQQILFYNIAKSIIKTNKKKSIELINRLDTKYFYGFRAYEHAIDENNDEIEHLILLLKGYCEVDLEHISTFLEIGFAIVDNFPFKAIEIFNFINSKEETPHEVLDFAIEISIALAKIDIDEAIKFINKIDEIYYKEKSFRLILKEVEDIKVIEKIIRDIIFL